MKTAFVEIFPFRYDPRRDTNCSSYCCGLVRTEFFANAKAIDTAHRLNAKGIGVRVYNRTGEISPDQLVEKMQRIADKGYVSGNECLVGQARTQAEEMAKFGLS